MQRQDCSLDQQFQQSVAQLAILALSQPRAAKLRVQAWLTKLREPTSNVVWKRNRNMYAALLLAQLQQGQLELPFTSMPPEGSLPNLPNHLVYRCLSPPRAASQLQSASASPVGASVPSHGRSPQKGGAAPQQHLAPEHLHGLVETFHSNMQARGFDLTRLRAGGAGHRDIEPSPRDGRPRQKLAAPSAHPTAEAAGPESARPTGSPSGGAGPARAPSGGRACGSRLGPGGRGEDAPKPATDRGDRGMQAQRDQQRASPRGDWGAAGAGYGHGNDAYTDQDAAAAALLVAREADVAARAAAAAKRQQHQADQQQRVTREAAEAATAAARREQHQRTAAAKAQLEDVILRYSDARQQWASPHGAAGLDHGGAGGHPAGPARGVAPSAW